VAVPRGGFLTRTSASLLRETRKGCGDRITADETGGTPEPQSHRVLQCRFLGSSPDEKSFHNVASRCEAGINCVTLKEEIPIEGVEPVSECLRHYEYIWGICLNLLVVMVGCPLRTYGAAANSLPKSAAGLNWVRLTDSAEGAFSMDVPLGWQLLGGMYRFGYFEVRWMMDVRWCPEGQRAWIDHEVHARAERRLEPQGSLALGWLIKVLEEPDGCRSVAGGVVV
jgi:hypothetical protein